MDEETSTIKQHIDWEREQLGRNLNEIERRVKNVTDLRSQFDRNTAWILGAAVAGGFLLSRTFGRSSPQPKRRWDSNSAERTNLPVQARPRVSTHLDRFSDTLDNIVAGLVGVAADKLHSFVADTVPGFREQYDAIDRQHARSSVGGS